MSVVMPKAQAKRMTKLIADIIAAANGTSPVIIEDLKLSDLGGKLGQNEITLGDYVLYQKRNNRPRHSIDEMARTYAYCIWAIREGVAQGCKDAEGTLGDYRDYCNDMDSINLTYHEFVRLEGQM